MGRGSGRAAGAAAAAGGVAARRAGRGCNRRGRGKDRCRLRRCGLRRCLLPHGRGGGGSRLPRCRRLLCRRRFPLRVDEADHLPDADLGSRFHRDGDHPCCGGRHRHVGLVRFQLQEVTAFLHKVALRFQPGGYDALCHGLPDARYFDFKLHFFTPDCPRSFRKVSLFSGRPSAAVLLGRGFVAAVARARRRL